MSDTNTRSEATRSDGAVRSHKLAPRIRLRGVTLKVHDGMGGIALLPAERYPHLAVQRFMK